MLNQINLLNVSNDIIIISFQISYRCRDNIVILNCVLDVFPSYCGQVLAHGVSSDCWGFLSIIVGSLPYNRNCLEATAVVMRHHTNKTD